MGIGYHLIQRTSLVRSDFPHLMTEHRVAGGVSDQSSRLFHRIVLHPSSLEFLPPPQKRPAPDPPRHGGRHNNRSKSVRATERLGIFVTPTTIPHDDEAPPPGRLPTFWPQANRARPSPSTATNGQACLECHLFHEIPKANPDAKQPGRETSETPEGGTRTYTRGASTPRTGCGSRRCSGGWQRGPRAGSWCPIAASGGGFPRRFDRFSFGSGQRPWRIQGSP